MIEIIDKSGRRYRYSDEHTWQFGHKAGTLDADDKSVVEILKEAPDGDSVLAMTFVDIVAVGDVDEDQCLMMPFAERQYSQCPRCGYNEEVER